ncbi:MAG TPA: hypothetical protein VHY22_18035 [Chthoniobacteraceae bacterium]|jgi:hypothetical protein|nr:hypothetical protein [Chthoniobacteraceae bacterium]
MNNPDSSLDRLLRAASRRQPAGLGNEEPPFGFATRVIAGWHAGSGRDRQGLDVVWFRRSLLCALVVMAISVGWSFKMDTSPANDELAIASYDANADIP